MTQFSETFQGFCMSKEGTYGEPCQIKSEEDVANFITENVTEYYELRITDRDDSLVFHVVDKVLLFPLTEGMSPRNRWHSVAGKFVEY